MSDDSRVETVRALRRDSEPVDDMAVDDLLDAYEERLRVNVGLIAENADLRKQLRLLNGATS